MPLPRVREEEWMDQPGVSASELRGALAYIRRVNRLLGYNRATRGRVQDWSREWQTGQEVTILDVATGSGDVPSDLFAWAARRGIRLKVVGLDLHPVTIREAARVVPAVRGDAMGLPFADDAFDYVLSSMFLHHLSESQVVAVLAEMWRVARRGVLAADLLRGRRALGWIKLFTAAATPMIRHDAVVSVRQAFTAEEMVGLAARAGWAAPEIRRHFAHRFTLVADKPGAA